MIPGEVSVSVVSANTGEQIKIETNVKANKSFLLFDIFLLLNGKLKMMMFNVF